MTAELRVGALERIGHQISEWRLTRLLGVGATAAVYEAVASNGERVAIKVLHARFAADAALKRRFLREAGMANRVDHTGVVKVQASGIDERGEAYLVFPYCEGRTAEALRLAAGGSIAEADVIQLARQLLHVLVAAHGSGVLHRDIKPANLFVTTDQRLLVLDFGIARCEELSNHSTGAGALLGTPAFMAPEQARGRVDLIDARTDLWAAGAALFTLLTGRHVHHAATANEQLGLAMTATAPLVRAIRPHTNPRLAAVIDRALRYDREARWSSAAEMLRALEDSHAQDGDPRAGGFEPATLIVAPRSKPKRKAAPLLAALLALIGSAAIVRAGVPSETPAPLRAVAHTASAFAARSRMSQPIAARRDASPSVAARRDASPSVAARRDALPSANEPLSNARSSPEPSPAMRTLAPSSSSRSSRVPLAARDDSERLLEIRY